MSIDGVHHYPNSKKLSDALQCDDKYFLDFLEKCLEWDQEKRLTPQKAIYHMWLSNE